MSEEAKKIVESVDKGILPPLNIQQKNNSINNEKIKHGLDRTTFGLKKDKEK